MMVTSTSRPLLRLAPLLLLGLLAGCFSRSDSLAPIISVTEPKSGTTRTTENLVISGYAMDDTGIADIHVSGVDLMASPQYADARGKELVQFKFRGQPRQDGDVTYTIEVEDVSGRVSTLAYKLRIDTTPPTLEFTPLGNGNVRITARDDNSVTLIEVDGVPLQFAPTPEYSTELTASGQTVEVSDSAGNVTSKTLQ